MEVIRVRNVNEALPIGVEYLRSNGKQRDSRNGPVMVAPCPVTTVYERPWERVLTNPVRDANPFFHLFESAWMLAGRNDVASVAYYVARMRTYSDDKKTLWGAYGHRWRRWFETPGLDGNGDQLQWAIDRLDKNPDDRRVVIQMWDAARDRTVADGNGKDVPCNTQLYVWVDLDGRLCITVTCRSNDMVWGAYGANAVHFSYLQEYIAQALSREMGPLYQVSNNYHGYLNTLEPLYGMPLEDPYAFDPEWAAAAFSRFPLFPFGDNKVFDDDLGLFLDEKVTIGVRSQWLRKVLTPVVMAYRAYKNTEDEQRFTTALEIVDQMKRHTPDWHHACVAWLARREEASKRAADDGVLHAS